MKKFLSIFFLCFYSFSDTLDANITILRLKHNRAIIKVEYTKEPPYEVILHFSSKFDIELSKEAKKRIFNLIVERIYSVYENADLKNFPSDITIKIINHKSKKILAVYEDSKLVIE